MEKAGWALFIPPHGEMSLERYNSSKQTEKKRRPGTNQSPQTKEPPKLLGFFSFLSFSFIFQTPGKLSFFLSGPIYPTTLSLSMPSFAPPLPVADPFGRKITYLRLSLTDRCNFRCTYCMAEDMEFLPRASILTLEENLRLARIFVSLGVEKLRLTGGEPMVRHNFLWLVEQLGALPGLQELVMTTNGSLLTRYGRDLAKAGVKRLNVSLDSLNPATFQRITRTDRLALVLEGIQAAQAAGLGPIKLNTVMQRGINDGELVSLTRYALGQGLDIAFIEEMPLGDLGHGRNTTFYSAEEALTQLKREFPLIPSLESSGGPARYWRVPGYSSRIGFIAPHSHNFCDSCNRLRVTARGDLYPCLGQNGGVALLPLLRAHPDEDEPVRQAILEAVAHKPQGHDFASQMDQPQVLRFMSMTGG